MTFLAVNSGRDERVPLSSTVPEATKSFVCFFALFLVQVNLFKMGVDPELLFIYSFFFFIFKFSFFFCRLVAGSGSVAREVSRPENSGRLVYYTSRPEFFEYIYNVYIYIFSNVIQCLTFLLRSTRCIYIALPRT